MHGCVKKDSKASTQLHECPGGPKRACTIKIEGQKPYFVMQMIGGEANHAKFFVPPVGTCLPQRECK